MQAAAKQSGNLLIVDDDRYILLSLEVLLKPYFKEVVSISDPDSIPDVLNQYTLDVIILDMNFKPGDTSGEAGIYWLQKIREEDPHACVVIITAYGEIAKAVHTVRAGAMDFVVKPWENEKMLSTVLAARELSFSRRKVDQLNQQRILLDNQVNRQFSGIVGSSKVVRALVEQVERIAPTDANVLIHGENGTGKEVFARAIHEHSQRRNEVMITVDVGSIPETLFESELFGHEKGAFTDAREKRIGRIETASGGTLFLDEVSNLPYHLQAKLLNVLQERKITRLGSNREIPVDIRLLSASNRPLETLVDEGTFRQDLFYRMNTIALEIPPLRERSEDIPRLAGHFFKTFRKKYQKPYLQFPDYVANKLKKYRWPGNVRELQHAMERAVILCTEKQLRVSDFQFLMALQKETFQHDDGYNLEKIEQTAIKKCIAKHSGNLTRAAEELGLTRGSLYRRMEKYGL
jgi:DNA-binding NtrC family response regulator